MGGTVLPQPSLYPEVILILNFFLFFLMEKDKEIEGESFFPIQVPIGAYYCYYGDMFLLILLLPPRSLQVVCQE